MKLLIATMLLAAGMANAQDVCPHFAPPQPEIAPQPGGWTFRPGRGVDMIFGAVPFPSPPASEGFLTIQYVATHNNPGNTCNWMRVDLIRVSVQSYADPAGTIDERTDVFELPFNTAQAQNYALDLNDRWIKRIDLAAHNSFGWSPDSNSSYSGPQYTGRRATSASMFPKMEWRSCLVEVENE